MSLTLPFSNRCHLAQFSPKPARKPSRRCTSLDSGLPTCVAGYRDARVMAATAGRVHGVGQGEAASRGRSVVFEYPTPDISGFWRVEDCPACVYASFVLGEKSDADTQCYSCAWNRWSRLRCDLLSSVWFRQRTLVRPTVGTIQ